MIIKRNITFCLEKRKDKNGNPIGENVPIRMRVVYGGKRIDFTTGYRIDTSKWKEDKERVKNGCTNKLKQSAATINADLSKYESDIQGIFKEFEVQEVIPTPEQIKDAFKDINKKQDNNTKKGEKTFFEYFDEFVRETGEKRRWKKPTYDKFSSVKNHLLKFNPLLMFSNWDEAGLWEYVHYLQNTVGMLDSTIDNQLDFLKWFLRWADEEKSYNSNTAYKKFNPNFEKGSKKVIYLTEDELVQLKSYDIPDSKQYLERVRDVFLFQCYSGLRYSDVYNLRCADIKKDYMEITTIKTKDNLKIELNKFSREILEKYKGVTFPENKVLPVISNQKMNVYLKELARLCGIDEPIRQTYFKGTERIDEIKPKYSLLGTHTGRRTFVCLSLIMGIAPHIVMKWTGHSDMKTLAVYVDAVDKDKQKAMKKWDEKEFDTESTNTSQLAKQLSSLPKEQLSLLLNQFNNKS